MNKDNYILELTPEEHYLLIQVLINISDICDAFSKDVDPSIDKIREELTINWAKRFQEEIL